MAEQRRRNQWDSIDASGRDWNAGEEFDPTPNAAAQSATTPQPAPQTQALPQTAQPAQALPQTAQPVRELAPTQTPQALPQTQAVAPQALPQTQAVPGATDGLRSLAAQTQAPIARADASAIRGYMEQARDFSVEQAGGQIDRAVAQSVNELQRTRESAEEQYRAQQNQIAADEKRALDNRALYDAMRGDRGGIGAEQYSSIMNAAATNRAALNNARTKLRADISLQMAQLRADGEFEKSQALLQATQQYLAQLAQLEQWEQEFNVGVDKFNAELEQARREYLFRLYQADIEKDRWEREFAWSRSVDQRNYNYQLSRDAVADTRYADETAYQRGIDERNYNYQLGRDAVSDARYADETAYQRGIDQRNYNYQLGRDAVSDARYADETAYQRGIDQRNYNYQLGRDAVADARYADETDYQRGRDALSDAERAKQDALSRAEAMMGVGMTPDETTLNAAGLTKDFAELYISALRQAQNLTKAEASGDLGALAKAYLDSGAASPKTWLTNNYKSFGFSSKPDADEFADAVDEEREERAKPGVKDARVGFSPDEGIITFDGQSFSELAEFADYVNARKFTESQWETLMRGISRWPELSAALTEVE